MPKHNLDPTIPLIVGVTGHRDLRPDDLPQLEQQVRNIFRLIPITCSLVFIEGVVGLATENVR